MAINVTKPAINLREKLNEVTLETGIKGEELLNSDTSTEARNVLELDTHLFTDFESTGIDDNATSTKLTVSATGVDVTGSVTCDGFTSTGIDDNATSTAITIDSGENVGIGTSVLTTNTAIKELHVSSPATNGVAQLKLSAPVENMEAKILMSGYLGQDSLNFGLGNTGLDSSITRMSIGTTGDVTVNTGNLVIGTSGKGIDFSAVSDGSRSVSSNILDDYEEGTWTPTFLNTTVSAGPNNTTGRYTKIGNIVHVNYYGNGLALAGGTMQMGGLPFTVASSTSYSTFHYVHGTASTGISTGGFFSASTNILTFIQQNSTTEAVWATGSTKYLMISGTYTVA